MESIIIYSIKAFSKSIKQVLIISRYYILIIQCPIYKNLPDANTKYKIKLIYNIK